MQAVEETSLQQLIITTQLITPTVSRSSSKSHYQHNSNHEPESLNIEFSQSEIAKLSRVENKLNPYSKGILKKWNAQQMLAKKRNKLSLITFSVMVFMITCGGPFGIESAIHSIGIFYTFIGLIIIPFIYSIPQSLMCSELSSMMALNGSVTIWVYRAFCDNKKYGDFFGFMNGLNCVIATGTDLPIYIVLLYEYLETVLAFNLNEYEEYFVKLSFLIVGALFNILNIQILGKTSIILSICILLPFLIGFFYATVDVKINLTKLLTPIHDNGDSYEWMLGLSTLIWLYSGWGIMCMLCGEIKFTKRKFHLPFLIAIVLDFLVYSLTLIAAITVDCGTAAHPDDTADSCWSNGYLSTVYNNLLHNLGYFVSVAAILSNFGKYIILLSAHARSLWCISQPYIMLTPNGKMVMNVDVDQNCNEESEEMNELETVVSNIAFEDNYTISSLQKIRIAILPHNFIGTTWKKTQSPVRAVLLTTFINAILIAFSFRVLVEVSVFFTCFTFVFKIAAFIKLRYVAPNVYRPYKICGGWFGAWCISVSQLIVIIMFIILSIIQKQPYIFIIACGVNVIIVIWYLFYRYSCGILIIPSASNTATPTTPSNSILKQLNEESKTWTCYNSNSKNIW